MNQAVEMIHVNKWMPLDLPRSAQTLPWVGSFMKSVSPQNPSTDVTRWDQRPTATRGDDYVPFFKTGT